MTKCDGERSDILNPTVPETFDIVEDILQEVNASFIDSYLHIGGDVSEEKMQCWEKR